jgi:hypothetical protein
MPAMILHVILWIATVCFGSFLVFLVLIGKYGIKERRRMEAENPVGRPSV